MNKTKIEIESNTSYIGNVTLSNVGQTTAVASTERRSVDRIKDGIVYYHVIAGLSCGHHGSSAIDAFREWAKYKVGYSPKYKEVMIDLNPAQKDDPGDVSKALLNLKRIPDDILVPIREAVKLWLRGRNEDEYIASLTPATALHAYCLATDKRVFDCENVLAALTAAQISNDAESLRIAVDRVKEPHDDAMEKAFTAFSFRDAGETVKAKVLFQEAFELEAKAADECAEILGFNRSTTILCRSAASLAFEAGMLREAENYVRFGLQFTPSEDTKDELLEVLVKVQVLKREAL